MTDYTDDQKAQIVAQPSVQLQISALTSAILAAAASLFPATPVVTAPITAAELPASVTPSAYANKVLTYPINTNTMAIQKDTTIIQLGNGQSVNVLSVTADAAGANYAVAIDQAISDGDINNVITKAGTVKARYGTPATSTPATSTSDSSTSDSSTSDSSTSATPATSTPVTTTTPAVSTLSVSFNPITGGDWINGVYQVAGVPMISVLYTADVEASTTVGAVGTFSDKSTGTVTMQQVSDDKSYINLKFDGSSMLNSSLGSPSTISFPAKTAAVAIASGTKSTVDVMTTATVTIDTSVNSRGGAKGQVFFNGGMGPGGSTVLAGRCGTNYGMISEAEIKELVAMGVTEIRHGFLAERVIQPGGKSVLIRGTNSNGDPQQFEAMLTVGKLCKQYGLKIMWDMHNYGVYSNTSTCLDAIDYNLDTWVADWVAIITALKADADTWSATARFDTMNEWTTNFTAAQIAAAFQKLLTAAGVLAGDKVFVLEGTYWSSCVNWVANVGSAYSALKHPVDNKYIEFSAHLYLNQSAGGMYDEGDTINASEGVTFDNIGVKRIASFAAWLKQYGFTGSIGESMVPGDCTNLLRGMRNLLLYCRANGINVYLFCWSGWAANSVHDLMSTRNVPMLNLAKEVLGSA